ALPVILDKAGSGTLTIDGNSAAITASATGFRFLDVASGGDLAVSNVTLNGATSANAGGGILATGDPTLNSDHPHSNQGTFGGAVSGSGVIVVTVTFIDSNTATSGGGGINYSGSLTISNSTISNNTATNFGGGINGNGTAGISNSTFDTNHA